MRRGSTPFSEQSIGKSTDPILEEKRIYLKTNSHSSRSIESCLPFNSLLRFGESLANGSRLMADSNLFKEGPIRSSIS